MHRIGTPTDRCLGKPSRAGASGRIAGLQNAGAIFGMTVTNGTTTGAAARPRTPPQILIPYDAREAFSVKEAAAFAGRSEATVRNWATLYDLGRRIGVGGWALSKPAVSMFLDG